MTTVKARYDGKVFVPEEPVDLPLGCILEFSIPSPPTANTTLAKLAQIADAFPENPNAPTDFAAQHDHFLYGTPKKS